jgi:gliding motility-associated-like protein
VCTGNIVVFQVGSSNSSKYVFDFGDFTPPLPTTNPFANHTYTMPGVYLPKVTLTDSTCMTDISGTDSLHADYITAGFKVDSVPFCDSTIITFTDSSYSFFGITSYEWSFNGNKYAGNTLTGKLLQTNSYPASLKVTGATGCTSQTASQVYVYVHQTPAGGIAINSDTCARDSIFFNAAVFSNDPVEYTWNLGNGARENGPAASTVFVQPGFYTINLSALSSFGCLDVINYVLGVKNTPVIKVFPGNDVWLCAGNTTELKAYSPYVTSWNWGPTTGLSCFNCSTTLANPANSTLYTVTGINDEGCSATDTVVLNVQHPFTISVSPPGISICTADSVLQPIQFFASGAENFTWSPATWLSDSAVFNPVLNIPPGAVETSGQLVYHITGYDSHYCFTDTTSIIVSIGVSPTINVGVGDSGVAGRVVVLTPLSVTNGPFKSFSWKVIRGNGTVACLNNICDSVQLAINSDVTFQVTAVTNLGCVATDTIHYTAFCDQDDDQVYIPTGFSPDGDGLNDVFMVQGKGIMVESFKVFNRWGQLVFDGGSNFAPGVAAHGWDGTFNGKPVEEDVYVYVAKVTCTAANTSYFRKGSVTLIRVKK